ncbi:MAG: stage II sporulation protein P [Clostridia bacterium]|nr:stage II sporulation protein P [Clostridia bacterium]
MEKERVEVFEQKMLSDGGARSTVREIGRAGRGFMRLIALGMSIFALIFILCCFGVGFSMANDADGAVDVTFGGGTTSAPSAVTTAPSGYGSDLVDVLKQMLGLMSGSSAGTTLPSVTTPAPLPDDTAHAPTTSAPDGGSVSPTKDIYEFDYALVPSGETAIVPYDLSLSSYGEGYIYNDTSYAPSIDALLKADTLPKFDYLNAAIYPVGDPVVLIIHTHGTEAYSPEGSISYDGVSELARSSDITQNVVAVGAVIAEVLNENGVRTLHCTTMHDAESYRDSYSRSAATIREYLAKYPSIKYVIDVHRDSVTNSAGSLLRPVTRVEGETAAQVMCVVGSDWGGADYPDWQDNLSFALKLRSALNAKYEKLCRPVYLRSSAYNQQYAPVSMLLEVGTSGNYLSEAKAAARLCAEELADIIKN